MSASKAQWASTHMLGQLCEPLPPGPWGGVWLPPCPGTGLVFCPGAPGVVSGRVVLVVVVLPLAVVDDVAAVAIAAPPPATPAVAAIVTSRGLNLRK